MTSPISKLARILLHPATVTGTLIAVTAGLYRLEGHASHMPFVLFVAGTMAAVLFLMSRRAAFSLYAAAATVSLIAIASFIKYRLMGFGLHVFDFVFTGLDPAAMVFLAKEYAFVVVPFLSMLVLGIVTLVWLARVGPKSDLPWWTRGILATAVAFCLFPSYPLSADQNRERYYVGGFDASTFFVSMLDLQHLVTDTQLTKRLAGQPPQPPYPAETGCAESGRRPDIFLVLSESQMSPAYFPELAEAQALAPNFLSQDGRLHPLQVETFGGGTWMSNLSVMTGLSTADFGFQAPYLTAVLEGKLGGALPEMLAACGYRTAAILPVEKSFVNEGRFLKSIGFQTVLGREDIGATQEVERDDFYFHAAEEFLRNHRETDGRPLFLAMQTLFSHAPYNDALSAEAGGGAQRFSSDPIIQEYFSRVALSRADVAGYRAVIEQETGPRGSVVVEYGDHHPYFTKPMADKLAKGNALADLGSIAYRTFASVHAYRYDLDMRAFGDGPLDIGFLGPALIEAAHLPASPMYKELIALKELCNGKFHACKDRAAIDRHLRRRVDSGMLRLFGPAS
ncbi:MAG: sulfatase-like hydrolase/transferase [Rhizobiales bacterium]|nr:sulfatase-like hydrolase/transferase [Hyphomicrobiales bacterium]